MANSKEMLSPEKSNMAFKVLDVLYSISAGYKYTFIPFENLYKELRKKDNKDQELVLKCFESLRNKGLVDSKALGTVSITHQGIKEIENIVLGSGKHIQFKSRLDDRLTNEDEIKTTQNQRVLFLKKGYEISKGSSTQPVSAFEIMDNLGYDKKTLERIYFYLEDEGLIKTFALGGKFTITKKGMKQAKP